MQMQMQHEMTDSDFADLLASHANEGAGPHGRDQVGQHHAVAAMLLQPSLSIYISDLYRGLAR